MRCPVCGIHGARRSRRQSLVDVLFGIAGVYPWRCSKCGTRFHARRVPLSHLLRAHCPICGNTDLQRISPEHVGGSLAFVSRMLRVPALRCDPCRYKYFSIFPLRQPL